MKVKGAYQKVVRRLPDPHQGYRHFYLLTMPVEIGTLGGKGVGINQ